MMALDACGSRRTPEVIEMGTSIQSSHPSMRTLRMESADRTEARRATTAKKDEPRTATATADTPASTPRTWAQRDSARSAARAGEDLARQHLLRNAAPASARLDALGATSTATARPTPVLTTGAAKTTAADGTTYPPHVQTAVDLVKSGKTDEATRTAIGDHFAGLTAAESTEAMDAIRAEGLVDDFLDATLRDENGKAVDPRIHEAAKKMVETGRLDAYAETYARSSFNVYTPVAGGEDRPHFAPDENGVYIPEATASSATLHETLTHETFHAFAHAHGSGRGAIDEGFGIAAIHYAFKDTPYSVAEAVYGTKNYYRDYLGDGHFPLGDMSQADPKLRELLGDITSRDSSQLAWDDPDQLQWDYVKYYEQHSRSDDDDGNGTPDWSQSGGHAETAEAAMLAGRDDPRGLFDSMRFAWWKLWN